MEVREDDADTVAPEKTPPKWLVIGIILVMAVSMIAIQLLPIGREFSYKLASVYWHLMSAGMATWVIPLAVGTLVLVVQLDNYLERRQKRWLEWSLFRIRMNVVVMPIALKRLGLVYAAALLYTLPFLAWLEELLFRYLVDHGIVPWLWPAASGTGYILAVIGSMILWGGVVFGLAHLVSFVTVRMGICLIVCGVVLSTVYLLTNVYVATVVHTTYNVAALVWIVYDLRYKEAVQQWITSLQGNPLFRHHLPTVSGWLQQRGYYQETN